MSTTEPPVFLKEMKQLLGVTSTEVIRQQIKKEKLPPFDVVVTQKTKYWHRDTLRKWKLIQ